MTQLVTWIDDKLATAIDELIEAGVVANRSQAVRLGLEHLVEHHRRETVGRRVVEGYRSAPQTESEVGWADEATRRMIADEPW